MKTPREILLARHHSVGPQLDAIRHQVIAGRIEQHDQEGSWFSHFAHSCRECLRMPRLVWAGFAAIWLVIIGLHVASREGLPAGEAMASARANRSPEMRQALAEQRRFFVELARSQTPADIPTFVPRPRSQRDEPIANV
jgi:hypothetical protein